MITTKQAAERLSLSVRRVKFLCKAGRIHGAEKVGRDYVIPEPVRVLPPAGREPRTLAVE